jgi:hypothetical protein
VYCALTCKRASCHLSMLEKRTQADKPDHFIKADMLQISEVFSCVLEPQPPLTFILLQYLMADSTCHDDELEAFLCK